MQLPIVLACTSRLHNFSLVDSLKKKKKKSQLKCLTIFVEIRLPVLRVDLTVYRAKCKCQIIVLLTLNLSTVPF